MKYLTLSMIALLTLAACEDMGGPSSNSTIGVDNPTLENTVDQDSEGPDEEDADTATN